MVLYKDHRQNIKIYNISKNNNFKNLRIMIYKVIDYKLQKMILILMNKIIKIINVRLLKKIFYANKDIIFKLKFLFNKVQNKLSKRMI